MSSGCEHRRRRPDGIGDNPTDLGAWEKFQLGWLGCPGVPGGAFYDVGAGRARSPSTSSAPNDAATKQAQALFVVLPDKKRSRQRSARRSRARGLFWSGDGRQPQQHDDEVVHARGGALTARSDLWYDTRRTSTTSSSRRRLTAAPRGRRSARTSPQPASADLGAGSTRAAPGSPARAAASTSTMTTTTRCRPARRRSASVTTTDGEHRREGRPDRQHRRSRGSAIEDCRDRHRGLDLRRLPPDRERHRGDACTSTRTSPRTGSTTTTTRRCGRPTTSASSIRSRTGSSTSRTRTGS